MTASTLLKLARRLVLLTFVLVALPVQAMEFRISTLLPGGTSEVRALERAGQEINEETDGRVSLRIFPGGVMGEGDAVERRIRSGQLHGALVQTGAIANTYNNVQILNAPFLFTDYEEVDFVRAQLEDDLEAELHARGRHTFGFIDGGFAYVMSQQPPRSVEDLRNSRLWLPANDSFSLQVARSFNVSPIVLNISEVLTSLQTGTVDTIIGPAVAALTLQWFTRVDYVTDMPLIYTFATLYIDERHLSQISDEDRVVVNSVLREVSASMDSNNRQNNRDAFQALLNQGLEEVELTEEEVAAVRDNAGRAHAALVDAGEFSQEWLDRLMQELETYRNNHQ